MFKTTATLRKVAVEYLKCRRVALTTPDCGSGPARGTSRGIVEPTSAARPVYTAWHSCASTMLRRKKPRSVCRGGRSITASAAACFQHTPLDRRLIAHICSMDGATGQSQTPLLRLQSIHVSASRSPTFAVGMGSQINQRNRCCLSRREHKEGTRHLSLLGKWRSFDGSQHLRMAAQHKEILVR